MKTGAECFESAFAHTLDLAVQYGAGFILEAQPGAPIPFDGRVTPRRKSRCDRANRNEMNAILSKNVLEQVIAVSMPPVGVGKRPPRRLALRQTVLKIRALYESVRWDGFRGLSYVLRRPGYCRPTHKPLRFLTVLRRRFFLSRGPDLPTATMPAHCESRSPVQRPQTEQRRWLRCG